MMKFDEKIQRKIKDKLKLEIQRLILREIRP